MTLALQLDSVSLAYGRTTVVHEVSLDVPQGEVCALLGASGSGKSTLLRSIAGLHRVKSGRLLVNGALADDGARAQIAPEKRSVGVVFQDYALFPNLNVRRNIAYGAPRGTDPTGKLLKQVGLSGYEKRRVAALSGGEQQRVALARVLAQQPSVVLLDEPFSNLDRSLRRRLRLDTFHAIRDAGAAAILVTHDPEEALAVADRVAVLSEGRMLQVDTPRAVYESPASREVALSTGDAFILEADADGNTLLGPVTTTGTGGQIVVRPEQIRLAESAGGVEAMVERTQFLGPHQLHHVRVGENAFWFPSNDAVKAQNSVRVEVRGTCKRV